jgi:hypothetical protein
LTDNDYFQEAYKESYDEDYEVYPFDRKLPWKNVSKLKHVKFESGDMMLVYEIWNQTDYQYTAYTILDSKAATLVPETKICYPIRLHRTESLVLTSSGNVQILEAKEGFVNIYTITKSKDPNYRREVDSAIKKI